MGCALDIGLCMKECSSSADWSLIERALDRPVKVIPPTISHANHTITNLDLLSISGHFTRHHRSAMVVGVV